MRMKPQFDEVRELPQKITVVGAGNVKLASGIQPTLSRTAAAHLHEPLNDTPEER